MVEERVAAGEGGSVPPITAAQRAAARQRPESWLYVIDPAFDPDGEVPPHGVVGAWWVDASGEIGGEFRHNPNYRPSALALGLAAAADPLEELMQLAAHGRATDADVVAALLDAELILFARADGGDGLYSAAGEDGRRLLQAFTSDRRLPPGWERWQRLTGRQLAPALPGHDLQLNPGGPISVTLPGEAVLAAASGSAGS
jgi:SseB protein N-terminal domain